MVYRIVNYLKINTIECATRRQYGCPERRDINLIIMKNNKHPFIQRIVYEMDTSVCHGNQGENDLVRVSQVSHFDTINSKYATKNAGGLSGGVAIASKKHSFKTVVPT